MELNKLVGIVIDDVPSMIDSKNGMVCLLYKHMHRLGIQNE
jgi:hypothetical protein